MTDNRSETQEEGNKHNPEIKATRPSQRKPVLTRPKGRKRCYGPRRSNRVREPRRRDGHPKTKWHQYKEEPPEEERQQTTTEAPARRHQKRPACGQKGESPTHIAAAEKSADKERASGTRADMDDNTPIRQPPEFERMYRRRQEGWD